MGWLVTFVELKTLCPPASAKKLKLGEGEKKPDWATTVLERLKDVGCDYVCPFVKQPCYRPATRQKGGYWTSVSVPVLDNYVPVRLSNGVTKDMLLGIRGVRFVMTNVDGACLTISDADMSEFKREYFRELIAMNKETFPLESGTVVRVIDGKYVGHDVTFKCADLIKQRARVAIEGMGREFEMNIPLDHVADFEL